jgi:hypothetical protein
VPQAYRVGATLLLAAAADIAIDPVHTHIPLCPFKAITGWQCPLCGGLRAVYELAHLRIGIALRDNVLVVVAIPLIVTLWLAWARRRVALRTPRWTLPMLVLLGVLFTVLRNLPPMTVLRP